MPGTYPPAAVAGSSFLPVCSILGWLGTPTTSASLVSLGASSQGYFSPDASCTIYMMSFSLVSNNGVGATITLQPYGSLSGGNGNNQGTSKQVTMPSSGPFVAYSASQSMAMTVGGYIGVLITSSVSNAQVGLNFHYWATQTTQ